MKSAKQTKIEIQAAINRVAHSNRKPQVKSLAKKLAPMVVGIVGGLVCLAVAKLVFGY